MTHRQMISFLRESLKPFRLLILGQIAVGIIWSIDLSLRPYILKIMIDKIPSLTNETIVPELKGPIFFYLFMGLFIVITMRFYDFMWLKFNSTLKRHMGDLLMKKMMQHSLSFFQNHFAGNLANKIKDVMSGLPDLIKVLIEEFFSHIIALLIAIFAVGSINYKFSMLLFTWVFLYVIGSIFFTKRAKALCEGAADVRSKVVGYMVDILSNISNVHLFSAQKTESKNLRIHLDTYVAADQKRDWWFLGMFAFQGSSFVLYQFFCFLLLIEDFKQGLITVGDFVLLLTLNVALVNSLWNLSRDILKFSELIGNITQGLRIVLSPWNIIDTPDALPLHASKGEIAFKAVKFNYKGSEPLFENKSILLKAGEKVGLVGYSGGGKSTFANLILRLYELTEGQILIDGQDIRHVTQESLRQAIALIPQDPSLFHRTLIDNIRYGKPKATDTEVIEAAKRAYAHDFIEALPEGYQSLVGERGVKLSGGQRQRIAIARAILKNAPILILDEATSQLDSLTEQKIQESLWELMQHKTTLVIAHRLSTLLKMDRILVFNRGEIIQDGPHQDLVSQKGLYQTLWKTQVGGFLSDKKEL